MAERFVNEYATTLNGTINASQTSVVVASAPPAALAGGTWRIRIENEWVTVTSFSGTTLTVTRGSEGSTAATHPNGAAVTHVLTSAGLAQIVADNQRELLTGARTYYVRTDGNDANTGLTDSSAGAYLTWQKAVNVVATLDLNNWVVTIKHGAEAGVKTFTLPAQVPTMVGGGSIVVEGKDAIGSTIFSTTGNAWTLNSTNCSVAFSNCRLQASGETGVIQVTGTSLLSIQSGVIFGPCSNAHIWVHDPQAMAYLLGASYTIANGGPYHIFVNMGGVFHESCTVTMAGTPAFSQAFIAAINGGKVQSPNSSAFLGATTGIRYTASGNGVINTFGGGANYFPGNAAGNVSAGGQYQ